MRNDDTDTSPQPDSSTAAEMPTLQSDPLKAAMIRALREASAAVAQMACDRVNGDEDASEDEKHDQIQAVNKAILILSGEAMQRINNADDHAQLIGVMKDMVESALVYDQEEQVTIPEESVVYPLITALLKGAVSHLDPQSKHLALDAEAHSQPVVSMIGIDRQVTRARDFAALLQRYHHDFNQQGVEMEAEEERLAELDGDALEPVRFAHKDQVSDAELAQCIEQALMKNFCNYRESALEHAGDDAAKDARLQSNQLLYTSLHEALLTDDKENSIDIRLMNEMDNCQLRDLSHTVRGDMLEASTWYKHFLSQLGAILATNVRPTLAVVGGAHKAKEIPADMFATADLLNDLSHMRRTLEDAPKAITVCDAIVRSMHKNAAPNDTAIQAQARAEGLDLKDLSSGEHEALADRMLETMRSYLQTRFFNRVNALRLRGPEGVLQLGFDDEDGTPETFPIHTYALISGAYEMARHCTPKNLEGTSLYGRQLKKNEDYFLTALALSESWSCDYPQDVALAADALKVAWENKGQGAALA